VYTDPRRPAGAILGDYEGVVDDRYLAEQEGRIATFRRNIRPLEALVPSHNGHRLLDVGAHVGVFVEVARERGWDAWGVEPSRWAVEVGRARGLQVVQGTLRDAELDSASFDAVTMWDVVEHLLDPMTDLQEVTRLLKPGGVFCVHTINIDSAFARLMGKRWPWLVEMHNYFFSPKTLGAMVEKAGLQVVSWRVQGRFLHLGYLLSRLSGWNESLGRFAEGIARALHVDQWLMPVNFGDLFTLYARKPEG
jgi:ubiquinone/menaquinone biosynthesis C-methylase UbiE